MKARGTHQPGVMNKLEAKYAAHLEELRKAGTIEGWRFEAVKLKLAKLAFYTPDFWVVLPDGTVEIHETKGFWRDDARLKVKFAAETFHEFIFRAVTWSKKDGWVYETFGMQEAA